MRRTTAGRTAQPVPADNRMEQRIASATKPAMRYIDDRLGSANFLRRSFNKIFPDHWSFMLGEIALYSFIILLLTGTYLALFFNDSQHEVIYNGTYVPLRGISMSEAYASTLHITFDVRAGLLMRQIHHWAALLFLASIVVHMSRVFFTGAFRKPREINWLIGVTLLILGILEGFAGYSLPDDLLSGTGIRIAYSVMESIPIVGSYMAYFVFGGNYPGESFIPRLFIVHVFLIPGIILGAITVHMMILWHQKHTDFPGPGKSEETVVGTRLWPGYALKGGGFFFLVFAVLTAMSAFFQINPIWLYGPYNPAQVSAGSQPDWYIGFLEGSLRMMPHWEWNFLGHTVTFSMLIPAVVLPGAMFTLLAVYPWLEAFFTKDRGYHNLLDRPRDRPFRVGIGVAALTFYFVLLGAGGNDLIATTFQIPLQTTTYIFRVLIFVLPLIAFYIARRWALGLQMADHHLLEHGVETGIIHRLPSGEYIELTEPLPEPRRALLEAVHGNGHGPNGHRPNGQGPNGHGPGAVAGTPGGRTGGRSTGGALRRPGARPGALASAQRALSDFFFERRVEAGDDEPEPPKTLTRPHD